MRKYFAIFFSTVLFLGLVSSASAYQYRQVLGVDNQKPNIDATVSGPGLILPDNPLFILDEIKQKVRLIRAFSPEDKAKIYASIADERMAELRFMIDKNNIWGIRTDLAGIVDNYKGVGNSLAQARLQGKNVSLLAKSINDSIKTKIELLDEFQAKSTGEMKTQIKLATDGLVAAKIKIDDSLSSEDLQNEIRDDLNRQVRKNVEEASQSAARMNALLDDLNKQIKDSSDRSIKLRQEALKKAIEEKNLQLRLAEEKFLKDEEAKQAKLLEQQTKLTQQAETAVLRVQEAADAIQQIKLTSEIQ